MAAPAAVPAAVAGTLIRFIHTRSPDYTVAADTAGLGEDPWVHLEGDSPLVGATSFAAWAVSPIVPPATASPGKCIRQSVLDSWCLMGGLVTPAFKRHPNVLLRASKANMASVLFQAHVTVGDLSITYTERTWMSALAASAKACLTDKRVRLEDNLFYDCEQRPATGAGSGAAENWMYGWEGSLLLEDDVTKVAAQCRCVGEGSVTQGAGV